MAPDEYTMSNEEEKKGTDSITNDAEKAHVDDVTLSQFLASKMTVTEGIVKIFLDPETRQIQLNFYSANKAHQPIDALFDHVDNCVWLHPVALVELLVVAFSPHISFDLAELYAYLKAEGLQKV